MKIYNFSDSSVNLVYNYLSYRSQCVTVNGINSDYKWVKTGVPQGSIIGPFLYNLYTMEIPNTISVECPHTINTINNEDYLFPKQCTMCGLILTFADDSSLIIKTIENGSNIDANQLHRILSKFEIFL